MACWGFGTLKFRVGIRLFRVVGAVRFRAWGLVHDKGFLQLAPGSCDLLPPTAVVGLRRTSCVRSFVPEGRFEVSVCPHIDNCRAKHRCFTKPLASLNSPSPLYLPKTPHMQRKVAEQNASPEPRCHLHRGCIPGLSPWRLAAKSASRSFRCKNHWWPLYRSAQ